MNSVRIYAANEQCSSEWTRPAILCERLLKIADFFTNINWNACSVSYSVDLCINRLEQRADVHQQQSRCSSSNVLVNLKHLLNWFWYYKTANNSFVTNQNNTISEFQSGSGSTSLHRFARVFYLEQTSIWAKSRNSWSYPLRLAAFVHSHSSVKSTLWGWGFTCMNHRDKGRGSNHTTSPHLNPHTGRHDLNL